MIDQAIANGLYLELLFAAMNLLAILPINNLMLFRQKGNGLISLMLISGVVIAAFTPHQLRHTYATLLYISGVDVKTASQLLGHSNITITLDIYTHLDKQFQKLNIQKFDNYIKSDLDIEKI